METYQAQCEDSVMGSIAPTWDLEQRIGPQQNRQAEAPSLPLAVPWVSGYILDR